MSHLFDNRLKEWAKIQGKIWDLNDPIHHKNGLPYVDLDGIKCWFQNDRLHREDGPSRTWENGDEEWYLNGLRHREDGPAFIYKDGTKKWYLYDYYHREDGPAVIEKDGRKEWWVNGERLTPEDIRTAKKIISGKYPFENLPLLINHPTLKYFALRKLGSYGT